jgi:hypothetical protein
MACIHLSTKCHGLGSMAWLRAVQSPAAQRSPIVTP